jgi:hypothetical protein
MFAKQTGNATDQAANARGSIQLARLGARRQQNATLRISAGTVKSTARLQSSLSEPYLVAGAQSFQLKIPGQFTMSRTTFKGYS